MNDDDLIKEFFRTNITEKGIQVLVCMIEWHGPYTSTTKWVVVKHLPQGASEKEVQDYMMGKLKDRRYFRVCQECDEQNPVGHMHDQHICQDCAERNHDIVY